MQVWVAARPPGGMVSGRRHQPQMPQPAHEEHRRRKQRDALVSPLLPHIALTISSVIFLASPNNIIVLSRKNSSFSMPAYPDPMPRLTKSTVPALSTSRIGMP